MLKRYLTKLSAVVLTIALSVFFLGCEDEQKPPPQEPQQPQGWSPPQDQPQQPEEPTDSPQEQGEDEDDTDKQPGGQDSMQW